MIRFKAGGIGVADQVEPVAAPALAITRGCEQPIDQLSYASGDCR